MLKRFFGKVKRSDRFDEKVMNWKEEKRLRQSNKYSMDTLNINKPHNWLTNPKRLKAFTHLLELNRNKNRHTMKELNDEDKKKYIKFKQDYQYYKYKEFLLNRHIELSKIKEEKNVLSEIQNLPHRLKKEIKNKMENEIIEVPEELDPNYLYYGQMLKVLPEEITLKIVLERRLDLIFKDKLIE